MSKISDASKKMKKAEFLFEDISEKCLKLVKHVSKNKYTEDSDIVKKLANTCEIDEEQSLSIVMNTVNLLTQDSLDFLNQKDAFDIFNPDQNLDECQFIAEIWNGDAYETTECDALDDFRRDIDDQYATLKDSNKLLDKCQKEYIELCKKGTR
jgi:hypothetical protein